jgi:hypothetical protein
VDVELAVDVVRLAVERQYEIGVILSTDTDLLPAIEAVDAYRALERVPRICTVAYDGLPKKLLMSDSRARQPYVFRLSRLDYVQVRDETVYVENDGSIPVPSPGDPGEPIAARLLEDENT